MAFRFSKSETNETNCIKSVESGYRWDIVLHYIATVLKDAGIISSNLLFHTAQGTILFLWTCLATFYRIDGQLVNLTARVGQKMKLDNGTVVMDIQKTFSSQSDETGVVLISLQYESGLLTSLRWGFGKTLWNSTILRKKRRAISIKSNLVITGYISI